MKFNTDLDAQTLRNVLHYDPITGLWHWLESRGTRKKGAQAGRNNGDGYQAIGLFGSKHLSARLAFLYMTGEWPPFEIDHRDGDHSNDKWENLRAATDTQNQGNKQCRKDSKISVKGVHASYRGKHVGQRYIARVQHNKRRLFLGYFSTIEEAKIAHDTAARKLFGAFWRT